MHVHIKHPATIKGLGLVIPKQIIALAPAVALPLIATGTATPIKFSASVPPDTDEEMEERRKRAKELGQDADWDRRPPPKRPRVGILATHFQAEETFGERFKRAVEKRTAPRRDAAKRQKERAEKQRQRYRPPPPRRK